MASVAAVIVVSRARPTDYGAGSREPSSAARAVTAASDAAFAFHPKSLSELLAAAPEKLGQCDIARMNLLCAEGLPGAENLDIDRSLATLDRWAEKARLETERHLYRACDPLWADHYRRSESYVRAELLAQVLQEDCGVHYNYDRIRNPDFRNSKDLLIHGMINSDNGGTCVSVPVLYAAVGRRLGYPIKLVLTKRHVFCRWDDGHGERFNIDPSTNGGIGFHTDDHYRTWPAPIDETAVTRGEYLRNLTPAEELSVFLASRGHCLNDNGRIAEAKEVYAAACGLMPQSLDTRSFLDDVRATLAKREVRLPPRPDPRRLPLPPPGPGPPGPEP